MVMPYTVESMAASFRIHIYTHTNECTLLNDMLPSLPSVAIQALAQCERVLYAAK